ncbi:MAG TPA: tRNA (guanosine(37)-N1)-methyltransferase TrmD [Candidatus Saccharimonadales bacterium]
MKIQIITLFPRMFSGVFAESMLYKAQKQKLAEIQTIDLRDFGTGPRKQVDDTPYGGGDGMLLKPEPIAAAIEHAKKSNSSAKVILLTPSGQTYKQSVAQNLSAESGLILICGRYEGVDERVTTIVDMELSVGNYVLTGGEIPAMVVVDSVVRLIPGVLGGETSAEIESFSDDKTLEYAQYTKPEEWRGMNVPPILLSGNHQEIAEWRRQQSIEKTKLRDEQNK